MTSFIVHRLLAGRTAIDLVLWGIVFLLILAGAGLTLRLEKRRYQAIGKEGSWLWLRLVSLPILLISGLAVWLPAQAISGPMALGFFYLALFTVAPITWFALHRIAGAIVSPRLTKTESDHAALTGLALLVLPLLLVNMLQGSVFKASHHWKKRQFANARQKPLSHEVQPMQRFRLDEHKEIHTQSLLAPPGVRIERIEALLGGNWHDTKTSMHSYYCRQDDDLHLAWPSGSAPPSLRLYWYNDNDELLQADFRIDSAAADRKPVVDFIVGWRSDGIDLPAPISRDNIQLGWADKAGNLIHRSLDTLQPGETFQNNCVMTGYRRTAWQEEGPIATLILRFHPNYPQKPWQHEVKRSG